MEEMTTKSAPPVRKRAASSRIRSGIDLIREPGLIGRQIQSVEPVRVRRVSTIRRSSSGIEDSVDLGRPGRRAGVGETCLVEGSDG